MLVMNYEGVIEKTDRALTEGFGMNFVAHADIASCFHSIYTHSIPWAIQGFQESKKELTSGGDKHWSTNLDTFQRKIKRNETQGIAIGSGTSSIVSEIILGAIDNILNKAGYKYHRYIDDYVCYAETHEKAQIFIQELGKALQKFKLDLNLHKTNILELPQPSKDNWVTELGMAQPTGYIDEDGYQRLTSEDVISYIDNAVRLNQSTPDGSVLKYAISYLSRYIDKYIAKQLLEYSINLAWHYPALIPLLDKMLSFDSISPNEYQNKINLLALESAKKVDPMEWHGPCII